MIRCALYSIIALTLAVFPVCGNAAKPYALILDQALPGADYIFALLVTKALEQRGFHVESTNGVSLSDDLLIRHWDVVVLTDSKRFPADASGQLIAYLRNGGTVIFFGGPPLSDMQYWKDGRWMSHADIRQTRLEPLSPKYKTYPVASAKLSRPDSQIDGVFQSVPKGQVNVICQMWRPCGQGFSSEEEYRCIPLLYAKTKSSGLGVASAITVCKNGALAYFGFDDPAFVTANRENLALAVANTASKLVRCPMLFSGGADTISVWHDKQSAKLKATVVRTGFGRNLRIRFDIKDAQKRRVFSRRVAVHQSRKDSKTITTECPHLPAGLYKIRCTLLSDGKVIDHTEHDFRVLTCESQKAFHSITVKNGEFMLDGSIWRGIGINYWPLYSSSVEPDDFFKSWLDPARYSPELIERDLSLLAKCGFNLISIACTQPSQAGSLMDFLARCKAHDIMVNIYLGVHPLKDDCAHAIELIRAARLEHNSAVFAYDLGWEVHVGNESARRSWDKQWQDWVIEQYGSIENAANEWAYRPQMNGDVIAGPTDDQLLNDGDWHLMVAAYRRFWDDFLCERYAKLVRKIRLSDKRHLLGARTGWAGCGQPMAVAGFAADLASGAIHLDFISPEYPSMEAQWPACLDGGLTTAYARFVGGGKPVYWAEYGMNLLAYGTASNPQSAQADQFRNIYRTLAASNANAGAAWWYPGGYRVDEQSDWGIFNPDYTPRPAALVPAAKLWPIKCKKPDSYINIDRDLYVRGYAGIFAAHKAEYINRTMSGQTVALRTEATGSDSSNVPLVAVGNVPCNGHNPPKYLNSQLEIKSVERVDTRCVHLSILAGNTGEAKWLAPRSNMECGAVYLVARIGTSEWKFPISSDVAYLSNTEIRGVLNDIPESTKEIELHMTAEGRVSFGRKLKIELMQGKADE